MMESRLAPYAHHSSPHSHPHALPHSQALPHSYTHPHSAIAASATPQDHDAGLDADPDAVVDNDSDADHHHHHHHHQQQQQHHHNSHNPHEAAALAAAAAAVATHDLPPQHHYHLPAVAVPVSVPVSVHGLKYDHDVKYEHDASGKYTPATATPSSASDYGLAPTSTPGRHAHAHSHSHSHSQQFPVYHQQQQQQPPPHGQLPQHQQHQQQHQQQPPPAYELRGHTPQPGMAHPASAHMPSSPAYSPQSQQHHYYGGPELPYQQGMYRDGYQGYSYGYAPTLMQRATPPGGGMPLGPTVYSFVPIPGTSATKRPRRRFEEIERMYKCGWDGCEKAYGTLNHLNAHVTMQAHGKKRSPDEFKEIRKEWKQRKKEEESRRHDEERLSVHGAGGLDSSGSGTPGPPVVVGYPPQHHLPMPHHQQLPPLGYAPAGGQPGPGQPGGHGGPGGPADMPPHYGGSSPSGVVQQHQHQQHQQHHYGYGYGQPGAGHAPPGSQGPPPPGHLYGAHGGHHDHSGQPPPLQNNGHAHNGHSLAHAHVHAQSISNAP